LARLTRHELKEDRINTAFEQYQQFGKEHYREIALFLAVGLVVVGLVFGLKLLIDRQEQLANAQLGAALESFRAYVGTPASGTLAPQTQTFPTAREKYNKALSQFSVITNVTGYPRLLPQQKAVRIARYHVGLCQAELGEDAGAIKTLTAVKDDRDPEIASLARFALAEELVKTGKNADAVKLFQQLIDHPTSTVPKATAELALANAYRDTQPAQARQIYQRMQIEFASDNLLADAVKQQIASLPK
jgi:tetratricopeptide (TPR) repeat protein